MYVRSKSKTPRTTRQGCERRADHQRRRPQGPAPGGGVRHGWKRSRRRTNGHRWEPTELERSRRRREQEGRVDDVLHAR
eukprot:603766-Rhodomonas_salina.1